MGINQKIDPRTLTLDELTEGVVIVFEEQLPDYDLNKDTGVRGLNLDSLDMVESILKIEDRVGDLPGNIRDRIEKAYDENKKYTIGDLSRTVYSSLHEDGEQRG
jgi:hypothetical protein